jgi:hypothetical protein
MEFFTRFRDSLDPSEYREWPASQVAKKLPTAIPKARAGENCAYLGNIAWEDDASPQTNGKLLVVRGNRLVEIDGPSGEAVHVAA